MLMATLPGDYLEFIMLAPLQPDGRVFVFMLAAAGLSALLFGLAPAIRATRELALQLEAAREAEAAALEMLYEHLRASAGLIQEWGPRRVARAVGPDILSADVIRKVTRDARITAIRDVRFTARAES